MKIIFLFLLTTTFLIGCGSDEDSSNTFEASREVVSISGGDIPSEADLVIAWILPDDKEFTEFITGGGNLSDGTFVVEPPEPIPNEIISETFGVATGFVVAFAKGEAPASGPYTTDADIAENNVFDNAIGIVNKHAIIYNNGDRNPSLFPEGTQWWADLFNIGYSCAKSIDVVDDFDRFEPTNCSSMVLSIGILDEIETVGGNWY